MEFAGEDTVKTLLMSDSIVSRHSRNNRLYPELCGFCCSHSALYRGRCELRLAYRRTCTGAGVGLLVLFKTNKHNMKENFAIMGILYVFGVAAGFVASLF